MITTAFLEFAYTALYQVLQWLPQGGGFPTEAHTAVSYLGQYVKMLDPLIPTSTLLVCVGIVFGVEIGIFTFRTVKWLLSHIPQFGGRG